MRWLVVAGLGCLFHFSWWFVTTSRIGYAPLYWLLVASLVYKALSMLHEWVHYVQVCQPVPPATPSAPRTVDMLTTACPGEPRAMIVRTLEAMQAVRYPHTSYLCDEGDDPQLRAACQRLGVVHVTRPVKVNAKAGNINNALRQATGELCVVLDPDHVPTPNFLHQVVPYFDDAQVGFVQVVQAYGNQAESLVARGAAQQTYHYYGPLMMGMNAYGTVQAIGANCTFRRAALDSIGGHAPGLTEDMHTAMRLHAAGWRSAYVPQVVSRGLVPASLAAFYAQQLKWSRGAFDLLFRVYPRLFARFSWAQRLHYFFLPLYFLSGIIAIIDLFLPLLSLGSSQFPWLVDLGELAVRSLPVLAMGLLIRCQAQRWLREPGEGGLHLVGGFLRMGTWWIYTLGFVYAVLGVRVPYIPTPKEGRRTNEWRLALPNLLLAALLLAACLYSLVTNRSQYTYAMMALAALNVVILLAVSLMGQHQLISRFVRGLATRPYRGLVVRLSQLRASSAHTVALLLRRFGGALTGAGLLALGLFYYVRAEWETRLPATWMLNGDRSLHIGYAAATADQRPRGVFARLAAPEPGCTITALDIAPLVAAGQLLPAAGSLVRQHQVPLLSWPVRAAATAQPHYWQALARQVKDVPGPVLLRPRLAAANPVQYRRAWKRMVEAFRHEHADNVAWIWTPCATDSLLQSFPGTAYTQWIAAPLLAAEEAPSYGVLRPRLVQNLALHQLPVLLLAPPPGTAPGRVARQLAAYYPEVKAVIFAAAPAATPGFHVSAVQRPRLNRLD